MAVIGTLVSNQPSSAGWWTECTLAVLQAVGGTASASGTVVYSNTAYREFQPSLPLAAVVLTPGTITSAAGSAYTSLQNGANTGLPAGIGICSITLGTTAQNTNTVNGVISYSESGTITIGFVNFAAAATVTAGTRFLFIQPQGN